jgi:hypothetical protein
MYRLAGLSALRRGFQLLSCSPVVASGSSGAHAARCKSDPDASTLEGNDVSTNQYKNSLHSFLYGRSSAVERSASAWIQRVQTTECSGCSEVCSQCKWIQWIQWPVDPVERRWQTGLALGFIAQHKKARLPALLLPLGAPPPLSPRGWRGGELAAGGVQAKADHAVT